MTLEEKLAMSKKTQKIVEQGIPLQQIQNRQQTQGVMTGSPEYLEEAVFGKVVKKNDGTDPYDAKDEMKKIMERNAQPLPSNLENSRIPKSIIESIRNNPLNMDVVDPKMDAFTQKLAETVPSIKRSLEIQNKLNETRPINEQPTQRQQVVESQPIVNIGGSGIDYEMIKLIVENTVKKEISSIKDNLISEGVSYGTASPNLKALKITDKFLFLDNDDNLYECQMKYIGKNKKKRKS